MRVGFKVAGDLAADVERDLDRMARAHTGAMRRAATGVKAAWRDEIRASGLGNKLANAVRSQGYPSNGTSINAAMQVWSNAPKIIAAHDEGTLIRSPAGFWLAIPLDAAGRAARGKRITPGEWEKRRGVRLRFVYRKGKTALLVADDARVNKRGQGLQKRGRRRKDGILTGSQTVPIFALVPQVKLRKRTDLLPAADAALAGVTADMIGWV